VGGSGSALNTGGGGNVRTSSDDVLGSFPVSGGVHLGTGSMGSYRGEGGLDTCGSGVQSSVSSLMRDVRNTRDSRTALGDGGDVIGSVLSTDWQQSVHVSRHHPQRG
jgi:hypothetical protein